MGDIRTLRTLNQMARPLAYEAAYRYWSQWSGDSDRLPQPAAYGLDTFAAQAIRDRINGETLRNGGQR